MKIKRWLTLVILISVILISGLTIGGCFAQPGTSADSTTTNTLTAEKTTTTAQISSSEMNNLPKLEGKATVEFIVNGSPITIEVNGDDAPITAGNFVDLVNKGVYDGLVFHRVVKDPQPFVVQGGDPQGKNPDFPASRLGTGSYIDPETSKPRYIPLEIKLEGDEEPTYSRAGISKSKVVLKHTRGAVAMARSQAPDSASSQFYFALADLAFLDGDYAVFGYVTEGMDVVDNIKQGDRIESATVILTWREDPR